MKIGDSGKYLCYQLEYVGDVQSYSLRNAQNFRIERETTSTILFQGSTFVQYATK